MATLAGLVAAAGTLAVAAAGFTLSFIAIRDVGIWAHMASRWAWMLPVAVDGAMATATVTAVVLHRLGRRTLYPWIVVLTGASISIACNALHAWSSGGAIALPRTVAMAVSAVPPVLLAMSVHLLVLLVDATSRRIATLRTSTEPATDPTASRVRRPDASDQASAGDELPRWPVDLLKRVPVNQDRYQMWQAAWADLQAGTDPDQVADRHGYQRRTIQFIVAAGQHGLLDSPLPPARRLAALATSDTDPTTTPPSTPAQHRRSEAATPGGQPHL